MEVRNPLSFLTKREASHTKTFITNLAIGLVAFLLFSGISSIASAQEETDENTEPTPAELRAERQAEMEARRETQKAALDARREEMASRTDALHDRVEDRKDTMASRTDAVREKIEERKAALSERARNRVLALGNNISEKMLAAITRIGNIIDRFEARIALLEEQGVDATDAQTKLDEAQEHLQTATHIIENEINTLIDNTVDSENPLETWVTARAKFQEAREAIRAAHQAVREALALLKEAVEAAELGRGVREAVRNGDGNNTEQDNSTDIEAEETSTSTDESTS